MVLRQLVIYSKLMYVLLLEFGFCSVIATAVFSLVLLTRSAASVESSLVAGDNLGSYKTNTCPPFLRYAQ